MVSLARLGVESGGTLTERTNASDVALDLALRRAAGTYMLSFKDDGRHDDRPRSVEVWLRPDGLRAVHAAVYAPRSDTAKRASLLDLAYAAPALFDTGVVHASLYAMHPRSRSTWRAEIVVSFTDASSDAAESRAHPKIEAAVIQGPDVIHEVERDVLPGTSTLIEPVDLKPGKYTIAAVLSDSTSTVPRATSMEVEVPEMPAGTAPFLVGPVLGRRPGGAAIVASDQDHTPSISFAPLAGSDVDPLSELAILTAVCVPGRKHTAIAPNANRVLRAVSGEVVLQFRGEGDVTAGDYLCVRHLDLVPAGMLAEGGAYVFEAGVGAGAEATKSVRFTAGNPQSVAVSR